MTALNLYRQWRHIMDLASQKRRAQHTLDAMLVGLEGNTYQLTAEGMTWELSVSSASPPALTVIALGATP